MELPGDGESSRTIVMMKTLRDVFYRDQDESVAQLVWQTPRGYNLLVFQRLDEAGTTLW